MNVFIVSTGLEVVGSSEGVAPCGSFGFECCCMSFAKLADASITSIASFAGWVFSSFSGDENGVAQVTDPSNSESE